MAVDRSIRKLMNQTIYVANPSGASNSGDRTFGTPVAVKARVEPSQDVTTTTSGGETVVSDFAILTEYYIHEKARVWTPGADQTSIKAGRTPMKVGKLFDENGSISHYEVFI